jgi:hypothetical protein
MASNITRSVAQIEMDLKKKLHNDLFKFLVCQECEEVPKKGPIYTCDAGDHATCHKCFQTSEICKCNADIKNRSKVLEKIRITLPLACKNRKNGCNTVSTLKSLLYHEVDCQFRGIFCPVLVCTEEVPNIIFKNLEDHLTEHHKDIYNAKTSYFESAFVIRESGFTSTSQAWGPTKLVVNNAQFFRVMDKENDRFYIWIYYYGSKKEAKNYHCTIKVVGGDGEEYIYNGPPRSLDESQDQIIQEENALILGVGQVKRIIVNKKRLQCSVKISCPKDEAREEDVESGISDNENQHQPKQD